MDNFQIDVINKFIAEAKTKDKVLAGLKLLKQQGIDSLETKESIEQSLLGNHVFRVLIADSPTQSEKEYLKKLWNVFNKETKKALQYDCTETTIGRHLLASVLDDKLLFETIINRGVFAELTQFIKSNPDFFKTNTNLKIFRSALKKILLCEDAGLKIDFEILMNTVEDNYKVKVPSKLYDFIKRHKDKLTDEEWDKLILKMLDNIKRSNYFSKWNKEDPFIGDIFTLVEQLNFPKRVKVEETIHLYSYFPSFSSILLLDNENKNLSIEEINKKWVKAIGSLDTKGFIKSDLWDKLYFCLDKKFITDCIISSIDVIREYDNHHGFNNPLGKRYFKLMQDESFKPLVLNMIFEHANIEANIKVYDQQKSGSNKDSTQYIYRFYINKLLDFPDQFTKIQKIIGNDLNDSIFKKIQQVIFLERAFPEKKQDSLKIKI